MTERFTVDDGLEDVICWEINDKENEDMTCGECAKLLNELHEENQSSKEFIEQLQEELVLFKEAGANMGIDLNAQITALKQENEQLKSRCNDYDKALKTLQDLTDRKLKENEQLKQFKEDVFNKIDMHLRMLPTARDNEFNEEDGDPSLYVGAIYMLETLKKELEE